MKYVGTKDKINVWYNDEHKLISLFFPTELLRSCLQEHEDNISTGRSIHSDRIYLYFNAEKVDE